MEKEDNVQEEISEKEVEIEEVDTKSKHREWVPRTRLGNDVLAGKYKSIEDILLKGIDIKEPEIVDHLVPDLKHEFIYIGGTPGKGGGIRRTPSRLTARMHKSGRRYKITALAVVGNENGIIGFGKASSSEHRIAMEKALKQAKLNLMLIKRGCGSWECNCKQEHSIKFSVSGKCGSIKVKLIPAPRGTGLVAGDEAKKILKLAGIKDIITRLHGQTGTRINLTYAFFEAFRNLNRVKGDLL